MRLVFTAFLLLVATAAVAQQHRHSVGHWTLRSADGEIGPVDAPVPGVVHTALHKAGMIPDPFFGDNEQRLAWVDSTTWVYETLISIPPLMQEPVLVFDGLDTLADIYVDDELVLSTDNMFRRWRVPLDPTIEAFDVRIVFHPVALEAERLASAYPYPLPESPRMFVRKAAYHFGWDWGPRFVTSGPWKGVFLEDATTPHFQGTHLRTLQISADAADVELVTSLRNTNDKSAELVIRMDGDEVVRTSIGGFTDEELRIPFSVNNPRLWWPRGSGAATLYDLDVEVAVGGHMIKDHQRVGIRTVELDQSEGAFSFVINGDLIYVKGANSAPITSFYPASEGLYRTVLQSAADANMNMIRVWGGGVYEDDVFYDLADSLGIMVWQDFMFANALYPDTDEFVANIREEATEQVQRLRRHPSIVLWCGNNEISEGWHNWGWQESLGYSEVDSLAIWQGYNHLFEELLPSVVRDYHEGAPYWPSSPSNGWARDVAYKEGDVHYWGVWWGRAPFESYREKIGRFNSEYGFQAYPVEATVRAFADDLTEDSEAFRNHQKHPRGFEWLREYAEMTFGYVPEDPGLWRYMTQVMQAEGVGMAIAGHRANKPRTMGTLYWQLNDVWPGISWSSMDFFGRWKPLHYQVRNLYQPLFAEVYEEGEGVQLFVVSDGRELISGRAIIEAFDTLEGRVWTDSVDLILEPPNAMADVIIGRRDAISAPDERLVFRIRISNGGDQLLSSTTTLIPRWKLNLPEPNVVIFREDGVTQLSTDVLALGVWLEDEEHGVNLPFNYVDLFPGQPISINVPEGVRASDLSIRSLYDLRRP